MKIQLVQEDVVDTVLDERLRMFLCEIFPEWSSVLSKRRTWHNTPPIFTVYAESPESTGSKIIGHVAVVVRDITTTWNFRYQVASIQGVAVAPEYRKTGIAQKLINAAISETMRLKFQYAILFCKEPLVHYYASLGWKLAEDNVVMRNELDLPISMRSNCPMYLELTGEPFPEGPIDVHDFIRH
ncbi:MAG: GNAT family N-acetyltransferase [Thermoguttaceae bacterium]